MPTIPSLPGAFTPEYLTDVLRGGGHLSSDSRVASLTREQVGDGTGMMAEISRLRVSYEGEPTDLPSSFVAKYASQNETNRGIALAYDLYERETRFANEIDPQTSARTPATWFSGTDEDRFLILMEDLEDYTVGSQVEGATLEQSALAMDVLADLHSAFWGRTETLSWVPGIANSFHATNMNEMSAVGVVGTTEKFGDVLATEIAGGHEAFLAAIPGMQAWMFNDPVTLVHGDFRMENLLYGNRPEHDPVVVIDWQGPMIARGMNDVALFLGQSTRTEVRREHERALLQRYLDGLAGHGINVGADEAFEDYRRSVMYNWVYAVVVAGTLDTSNETAYNWMREMIRRQSAASIDLDVFSLMP